MSQTIAVYNSELARWCDHCAANPNEPQGDTAVADFVTKDADQISWSRSLRGHLRQRRLVPFDETHLATSTYRPFSKQHLYFDRFMNHERSQLAQMFPTSEHSNYGFYYVGVGSAVPFSVLMVDSIPDLHVTGAGSGGQFFSRFTYEKIENDGALFDTGEGEVVDGYRRVDNITDEALARFQTAYGTGITKDDVFFYVYALLHCPGYRVQFAADLKKMLPRIPLVANATPFVDAGRTLSELHLGYESATPYPLDGLDFGDNSPPDASDAAHQQFRVEKMRFGKPTPAQKQAGLRDDRSTIVYNGQITLRGVPQEAYRYLLGSRSAIEWIMERYQVKVDSPSGITNDPNDWSREVGNPRYILDLLARIVTVSLETMKIIDALPSLSVRANQPK